jgi:DNA-binding transcriptional ArsR family regulator
MSTSFRPLAHTADVLTEELDDELLVYDEHRQLACRLNRTAALVWRSADGERTVADLVEVLRDELGDLADEDLVMVTLDRLEEQGLMEAGYPRRDPDTARLSRRRFIRRVGVVGTAALALPVVQSIVAPAPAAAQSTCSGPYCVTCGYCKTCYCVDSCYCEPCPPCEGCFAGRRPARR